MDVGESPEFLKYISYGTVQSRLLSSLVDAYPKGLTKQRLIHAAYCDHIDGGPENAENSISVIIFRLRKSIKKYGWRIPPVKPGPVDEFCVYRLERIDAVLDDGGSNE